MHKTPNKTKLKSVITHHGLMTVYYSRIVEKELLITKMTEREFRGWYDV